MLSPRLLRLEWDAEGRFVDERTPLVDDRAFEPAAFTIRTLDQGVEITTSHLRLRYTGGPFTGSSLAITLLTGGTDPHYTTWRYGDAYPQDPPLRGNLQGTARTLDEVDGACPLEPGLLATYGFSVLDDSTSVVLTADGWVGPRPSLGSAATPPARDLYFFGHGRDYAAALADYHHLTGPTPLVPARSSATRSWYWRYSAAEYLGLMDHFAARRLPFSVAVIDMDLAPRRRRPGDRHGLDRLHLEPRPVPRPALLPFPNLHDRGLLVTLNVPLIYLLVNF